ncbi:MAG: aldose 1-epimerase family protein [Planctomycetaceae bacterium]|nr:aldose 1-epimerase family protein [Planctomycetaceae bacterium]
MRHCNANSTLCNNKSQFQDSAAFLVIAGVIAWVAGASTMVANADDAYLATITSGSGESPSEWAISSTEITPRCPHRWAVRKRTLRGGRQEGVEVITIDTGKLLIHVCPTRGMGILDVAMGDVRLKWDSPVRDIVNPQFINLNSRGGLGWLEGFNEFMCRCGMESNGHPGTDKFINNVGDEAEMELTLHGKVANLPAQTVDVRVDRTAPYAIHIMARVDEKLLFGPKLELHTQLTVVPGESRFTVTDEIRNVGAQPQEFQMLYHANFGSPLLEEGAEVVVPSVKVAPFNDRAAEGLATWNQYEAPKTGFIEQVYLIEPASDQHRMTTALLHNRQKTQAASITWSLDELPYLTVWKNTGALADGYVTGIEPGTNYPNNRSVERGAGRVPVLAAGESHRMSLQFDLYSGEAAVAGAISNVQDIEKK